MFESVLQIRSARTINLRRLIQLVEGDPKTFLRGANLDGVDLSGQDIRGISLEEVVLDGVIANTRTQTDSAETKISLLKASISTYQNAIERVAEPRKRGEFLIEIAASAAYIGEDRLAKKKLSEIDHYNCPESISAIINDDIQKIGYEPIRVIGLWMEIFGQSDRAYDTFISLSGSGFNIYWMGAAVDWIFMARERDATRRLAKQLISGPDSEIFLNEVKNRLKAKNRSGRDAVIWSVQNTLFHGTEIYLDVVKGFLQNDWHKTAPTKTKTDIFKRVLLSDLGEYAVDLINSYADRRKREDWIVAITQSVELATSDRQFSAIDKAARRLDLPLPRLLTKESSRKERQQYLDAALAQLRRIEPNLSARIRDVRTAVQPLEQDFPERSELYVATMHALKALGGRGSNREIEEGVARRLRLSDHAKQIPRGQDHRTKFQYELAWVRTYLKWGEAIENAGRGVWATTDFGELMSDDELRGLWRRVVSMRRSAKSRAVASIFAL